MSIRRLFTELKKKIEESRRPQRLKREHARTIGRGDIKVYVDDNNRVRLFCRGHELTKGSGLVTSFLSEAAWHHSTESEVIVTKLSECEMRLALYFPAIQLSQEWKIWIDPEMLIICDIRTELKNLARIDAIKATLLLSKVFNRWIYPPRVEAFPPEFGAAWDVAGNLETGDKFIGCLSSLKEYPGISLQSAGSFKTVFGVGNTDNILSSRAIEATIEEIDEHLKPGAYDHFKIIIRLDPDQSVLQGVLDNIEKQRQEEELRQKRQREEEERKRQEEELRQKRQREEEERKRQEEELSRRNMQQGDFKIFFDQTNHLRVFYKENEITKAHALQTGVLSAGKWHSPIDSLVQIERPSSQEMVIYFHLKQIPLTYIWHCTLTAQGVLEWNVDISIKAPMPIDRRNAFLMTSKNYTQWFASPKAGNFPRAFSEHWQTINSPEENPDFIALLSSSKELPDIILKELGESKSAFFIQNTDATLSSRVLEVQAEENKESYRPGTYECFKLLIQFYPDKTILEEILAKIKKKQLEEEERKRQEEELRQKRQREEEERKRQEEELRQKRQREEEERKRQEEEALKRKQQEEEEDLRRRNMQQGDFKIVLDQANCLHIFYKENEITKAHTLHTGVLSAGKWHSPIDSLIQIERPSSQEMVIYFHLKQIPLTYIWHCTLTAQGVLEWNVDISIKAPMPIDRKNASLMASKLYTGWFASPKEGVFPRTFSEHWQSMNVPDETTGFIALLSSSKELPDVVFKDLSESESAFFIQNTDATLSSRVLEVQAEENKENYQPGTYECFKLLIQFYPDKATLQEVLAKIKKQHQEEEEAQLRQRQIEEELRKKKQREEEALQRAEKEFRERVLEYFTQDHDWKPPADQEKLIVLFGDSAQLHDKIAGKAGDFQENTKKIKDAKADYHIKIGISRYNFFKLPVIVQYSAMLMKHRIDLRALSLPLFPVKDLYGNFNNYLRELNQRLQGYKIYFFLQDEALPALLHTISSQSNQYNERELLRLLGIIAEHPFIGPQTIVLDTYHRCNTNCLHCWIHTPKRRRTGRQGDLKMSTSLYKGIVDDAVRTLSDEIIIQGDGEPMLDTRFMEMVTYARDKGLKVLFFTNGTLLNKDKIRQIIDLEVNEIFCSLPAGTAKTYALINPRLSEEMFAHTTQNLKNLIEERKKNKRDKPLLQMTHVIHSLNYHELEEMAKLDASIGADKVRFYLVRLDKNISSLKLEAGHIKAMQKSLARIGPFLKDKGIQLQDNIQFQLQHYNPATGDWSGSTFLHVGCPVGWFFSLILFNGSMSVCCHLRIIDILRKKKFSEAWNSQEYNQVRIKAKYLMKNRNALLLNGQKLFDDFCQHCDTHQVILRINQLMEQYRLDKFFKEAFL